MDIRKIPINELLPADYNPRADLREEDEAYKSLEKSMDAFGYVAPIVWNQRTGNVIGGHQRLKILLAKGHEEVEVSRVDLSEDDEKLLNLALNKITGRWDMDKLEEVLKEIEGSESDILLSGFSQEELDDLLVDVDDEAIMDLFVEKMDDGEGASTGREQGETREDSMWQRQPVETAAEDVQEAWANGDGKRRIQCPNCGEWIECQ